MWQKLLVACVCVFVLSLAVDVSSRPKNCAAGTTYKKDCNTCTCAADGKDKCGNVDCSRTGSTAKPANGGRPGDCPKLVPEPAGSGICANRKKESECVKDTDCGQAKKCCIDGCNKWLCRAAVYNYTR